MDAARPGEVLITAATRREVQGRDGFEIEERGTRRFKHVVDPIPVFEALAPGGRPRHLEIDPVCRMAVDPSRAASSSRRLGLSYYFCSANCREKFDAAPKSYIATSAGARVARRGFLINFSAFAIVGAVHLISWAARGFSGASPGMFLLLSVWAAALVFHYRAVRRVL